MFEWFLRLFGLKKSSSEDEKNNVPASEPQAKETPVSEPKQSDATETVFIERDAYGNKVYFQDEKAAEKFRAEQKRSQEEKPASSASNPITKDWYRSVGQETQQSTSENTSTKERTYKPNFQFATYSSSEDNDNRDFFVKVQFPYSSNGYDYLCEDYTVRVGEWVSVPTPKGLKRAQVIEVFFKNIYSMPMPKHKYKKIYTVLRGNDTPKTDRFYNAKRKTQTPKYEEKRCVSVIFETDGNEYSYLCEDELIGIDDFVIVKARGKEKIAKIVDVFEEVAPKWRPIIREADRWEIEEARERFDEFYHFHKADREYEEEQARCENEQRNYKTNYHASNNTSSFAYDDDEADDEYEKYHSSRMTDERGYMRNGKAEAYEEQLRKAAKAGRLTDDRGFILDPHYAERLRENFAYDHLYSNGYQDDEDEEYPNDERYED